MARFISIRYKGGSDKYQQQQFASMKKQEALQAELDRIDLEFYNLRQSNQAMYESQFRPFEEMLLNRSTAPLRETTSAAARAATYDAQAQASDEALARRNARYGVEGQGNDLQDSVVRAIALSAVGNQAGASSVALRDQYSNAALGVGAGINTDIATGYQRAFGGLQEGASHLDAAFANYSQAQGNMNDAFSLKAQGISGLGASVFGAAKMGIGNYNTAKTNDILMNGTGDVGWQAAFTGGGGTW